jgi:hypothetical protein
MAVALYFAPRSLSTAQYEEVTARLGAAGVMPPAGCQSHCAFAAGPGGLHVFEVWESAEAFQAFAATLMPILAEVGVEVGQPLVTPVHNFFTT